MQAEFCNLDSIPVGPLCIIQMASCSELGKKVDKHLVSWRHEREHAQKRTVALKEYEKESYVINAKVPRFGSGEAKGIITESVRGDDLYILVDVCNYSLTYSLSGHTNHMSPDDHYQDLKRIIAAAEGKAKRINVIMPFLYEGRQHKRNGRESLDCALALQELTKMGVDNIITFDAHDPRVQNAIPLHGFETVQPVYQFIKGFFKAAGKADPQYCTGIMGHGIADQLKHLMYNQYDTEDLRNSCTWGTRLFHGSYHHDLCIFKAYLFKKVETGIFLSTKSTL